MGRGDESLITGLFHSFMGNWMTVKSEECRIRFARKADLEYIAELKFRGDEYHSQFDLWPPECEMGEARRTMRKHLGNRKSKIFVAVDGSGHINGFVLIHLKKRDTRHADYKHVGEIGLIYVKQDYWRKGIGTRLVRRAIEYFESKGIEQVTQRVVAPNARGIGFWDSLSFETKVLAKTATVDNVKKRLKKSTGQ